MKLFGILGMLLALAVCQKAQAQTVTVDWTTTHQTIDGFGVEFDTYLGGMPAGQLDQVFSTTVGAGLSLLRVQAPDGDTSGNDNPGDCSSVGAACSGRVSDMLGAIDRGAKVWASSYSPPASMKVINGAGGTPGNVFCMQGSNTTSLATASYAAFATWQANYIASLAAVGVPLYAISVQNEPNYCPTGYGGTAWTAAQFDSYVKTYLAPTITALPSPQNSTLIIMPEPGKSSLVGTYANTAFADSSRPALLQIAGTHNYDNYNSTAGSFQIPTTSPAYPNAPRYWETEVYASISGVNTYDPSIADGLAWAQVIHNWMTIANANAWHWWTIDETGGPTTNEGLYGPDTTTPAKRLWVIGQWSKFVRPGWVRIGATANPATGVFVSAFNQASTGDFAIVAVSNSGNNTAVTFSLSGFPGSPSSVTPWITSNALNLAEQSNVPVSNESFSYTLPAHSVTSFVGNTADTNALAPPLQLKAVVQ
jgi:glucuronoarabinoxylan endo-1,4-beta-xylanase